MIIQDVTELIRKILIEEGFVFETELFNEEKTLEEIGMDSLDTLNFIASCEKKFSIELDGGDILTTSTLQSVIETIYYIKN